MKPNALALALISSATALPATAHAANDICSQLIIFAVTQFCQILPNGQNLCQPIGLARPDPTCNPPSANQVVQIPLGPPSIQTWPYAQFPTAPNPFAQNPFAANAFVPNFPTPSAFAPNTFAPNTFVPNTSAPTAFVPKQFASNPYLTYLAGQPANAGIPSTAQPTAPISAPGLAAKAPDSEPTKAPVAPPVQMPAMVAEIKPEAIVVASPMPAVAQPIDKLMPEAKPEAKPESPPTVSAKADTPPAVEQAAAGVGTVAATVVAPQPEPAAVQMPPAVETKPVEKNVAQVSTEAAPASPVQTEAAKQAEVAKNEAEKARQDALAHFEFDSAELTPAGRTMLDEWLKQASPNDPILVTGHADRLGPEPYNNKLSLLRAESVRKYLVNKGKPAKRIEIQAKGEKFPLISCTGAPNDATIACLAPNRRAEIFFKPSVRKVARTATKLIKPKASR